MLNQIFSSISKKSKKKQLIGLDIGNYSVKALGINFTRTGQKVECLAMVEVPLEKRENRRDPGVFTELIKNCLAKGRIVDKDVVIMISGSQVFIRRITMPQMPREELDDVMPFEVKKHVSFPADQMAMDYMIVREKEEDGINKLDIILIATPKELVEQEISIVRAAGLKPVAVSVAPMVLWKTFQLSKKTYEEKIIALLDIGYEKTIISLLNNGILEFTRTINLGGDEITNALMTEPLVTEEGSSHVLTYEEAENIKREYGLLSSTATGTTAKEGVSPDQIPRLTRPFLERLLSEVKTSFDFYMTEFQIPNVEKIIISGGSAGLRGLREFMVGDLGIETELADPFQSVDFAGRISKDDFTDVAAAFVMPLGLAAWEKGDLSLLRMKKNLGRGLIKPLVAPIGVAVILILILYWSVSTELASSSVELDKKTKELAFQSPLSIAALTLSAKKRSLQSEINALPQALSERVDSAGILEEIRRSIPENTRLEVIDVVPQSGRKLIRIYGTAFFLGEKGPSMSDFMAALKKSPLFNDIRMLSLEEDKSYTTDGLRFELNFQYVNEIGGG